MTLSLIDGFLLGFIRSLVRPVVVVDTKAVINSACYRVRTGRPGRLEQATQNLIPVPLLVPRHVIEEVEQHLAARALDEGLDPSEVSGVWNKQLRPHIRVVDLAIRDHLDPRLRGVLADDPDDLPTAALALLVAPAVVFSDDHDLIDNGFAGQVWWTKAAGDVLIVAVADGHFVSVLAAMSWTAVGTGYGTAALVRAARRTPWIATTVAAVALTSAYLLARRFSPGRVRATFKEFGTAAATMWREMADSQQTAAARLPWVKIPAGRPPTLEERCARILARITGTLSAADLHEQLRRDMAEAVPSVPTVHRVLAGHPAFVQVDQDCWQLGEPAGAPPVLLT